MPAGVYTAYKKDGTVYYRSSITHKNKHISLGSFSSENEAAVTYNESMRNIVPQRFAHHKYRTPHNILFSRHEYTF